MKYFIIDRMNPLLKKELYCLIERSKTEKNCKSKCKCIYKFLVIFSNLNFRGIRICGANLSGSI